MILKPPPKLTNRRGYLGYLEIDLWGWMKQLATGILKIDFKENFQSFTVQNLEIKAGTEVAIKNQFLTVYPGIIPSARLIVRQTGDAVIVDGPTKWNEKLVFLSNPSANDAVITVIFFK